MKKALRRRLSAALALRALTIAVTSLMLVLGALAAHHADSGELREGASFASAMQDPHGTVSAGSESAEESVLVTLGVGCVVLAICCLLALALVSRSRWTAMLARYLGVVNPSRIQSRIERTFASALAGPSLFSLSISRT